VAWSIMPRAGVLNMHLQGKCATTWQYANGEFSARHGKCEVHMALTHWPF